ncbi:MAG TPA: DUF6600 domain-containing protein [Bryobacteraceae bacterium]|nr:DUF6600 domain-containing protein [Bryobacteraceae bacterium]
MPKRILMMAGLIALGIGALAAQDPPSRVARLNYISGSVSFQPAGVQDWVPATVNRPMTIGDQLWNDDGARSEMHVPGAAIRLSSRTAFEFLNLDDQTVQIKVSEGSIDVRLRRLDQNTSFEIDTPNLAFTLLRPGDYRLDTNPDTFETYVTVRSGQGEITGGGQAFSVNPGQQAYVSGNGQITYQVAPAPGPDEFDQWAESRDRNEDRLVSSRYVSPDVVGYEDLDEYGSWAPASGYGDVWYPRQVAAGWSPYQTGHWAWIEPWGWTWVDDAPWGFAPFHYGRWAYIGNRWGWCPGPIGVGVRPVYAPALVAWVGAGAGFSFGVSFGGGAGVGWFPLGPRDVFIPSYRVSPVYVNRVNITNTRITNINVTNVYNNYQRNGSITNVRYENANVRGALIAVPQNSFASARPVQQYAVRLPANQANQLARARFMTAPAVVPQRDSVLGRPIPAGRSVIAARPPVNLANRAVVAKLAPPPRAVPFAQRQAELARTPGRPLPIQQIRPNTPSARPSPAAVRMAPPAVRVTPRVANVQRPPQPVWRNQAAQRGVSPQAAQPRSASPQVAQPRGASPQAAQPRPQQPAPAARPTPRAEQPTYRPPNATEAPTNPGPASRPNNTRPTYRPGTNETPTNRPNVNPQAEPRPNTQQPTYRPNNNPPRPNVEERRPVPSQQQARPAEPQNSQPRRAEPAPQQQREVQPQQRQETPRYSPPPRQPQPQQREAQPQQREAPQQQRAAPRSYEPPREQQRSQPARESKPSKEKEKDNQR